jgi:hypothetical protein
MQMTDPPQQHEITILLEKSMQEQEQHLILLIRVQQQQVWPPAIPAWIIEYRILSKSHSCVWIDDL